MYSRDYEQCDTRVREHLRGVQGHARLAAIVTHRRRHGLQRPSFLEEVHALEEETGMYA